MLGFYANQDLCFCVSRSRAILLDAVNTGIHF